MFCTSRVLSRCSLRNYYSHLLSTELIKSTNIRFLFPRLWQGAFMSLVCTSRQKPHVTQDKPTRGFNNSTHIIIPFRILTATASVGRQRKTHARNPPPQKVYKGTFSWGWLAHCWNHWNIVAKKKVKKKRICTKAFWRAHHPKPINSKPMFSFFISWCT
jgi:hypothetical protein